MSNKELKTRIQMKNDTAENWATASTNGFIPKLGEPIFYKEQDGAGFKFSIKIGDGVRTPDNLPAYAGNWNDLTDKPFYDETLEPIVWDGNTEGHETVDLGTVTANLSGQYLVHVSDVVLTKDMCIGATVGVKIGNNSGLNEYIVTEDNLIEGKGGVAIDTYRIISTSEASESLMGFTINFPKPGTYFLYQDGTIAVREIEFPSQVKPLDEKYLPDTVATTTYVDEKIAEIPEQVQVDWTQTDDTQADFIKNKPTLGTLASKDKVAKEDLTSDIQEILNQVIITADNTDIDTFFPIDEEGDSSGSGKAVE